MVKNKVLPRYKRTRWHSVVRDSSIHRAGRDDPVIADLIRNSEVRQVRADNKTTQPTAPSYWL